MFIDTHSHLNFSPFKQDIKEVISRAKEIGISAILNVGADLPTSKRAVEIAREEDLCYAAVGIHPTSTGNLKNEDYRELEKLGREKKVVAIGEIGLDWFHNQVLKEIQKESFEKQILLAKKLGLPLIIHNRDANAETLSILKEKNVRKGVMHCFSGDINFAKEVLSLGLYISFTGNLTYKKNESLRGVAKEIPLEKILLETDCPYLPPQPKRGMRNEPSFLVYTAEELAKIKGVSMEALGEATSKNAQDLFGLKNNETARKV